MNPEEKQGSLNHAGSKKQTLITGVLTVLFFWLGPALPVNAASSGMVVAWGYNYYHQTTIPAGLDRVTSISAGYLHSVALNYDGTVAAWGFNDYGQTTVSAGLSGVTAIAAGGNHTVALKNDGIVAAWGDSANGDASVPAGLSGVTAIAAGTFHTVALVGTGPPITVQSTGNNLTLLWPVTPLAYRVESTLSLSPPNTWSNVTDTFPTNGGFVSVVVPITGGQKFYRLVTP